MTRIQSPTTGALDNCDDHLRHPSPIRLALLQREGIVPTSSIEHQDANHTVPILLAMDYDEETHSMQPRVVFYQPTNLSKLLGQTTPDGAVIIGYTNRDALYQYFTNIGFR